VATISVRIEDEVKDMAEEAAAAIGMTISQWTRDLIRSELGLTVDDRRSAPASLTKFDRKHLVMLHQLALAVTSDEYERKDHQRQIEVLEYGFTGEYDEQFTMIYDELPLEECRLVWDLLDMFRVLKASVKEVGFEAVKQINERAEFALRFSGFDFNDPREGRLADYAEYLTTKKGRWSELVEHFDDQHERGNSHCPMLEHYRSMLAAFQPIWQQKVRGTGRGNYLLDLDELARVAAAS
jgi:uncharacterized protein YfbU (UPF0304 family)